jgi:hypothetical protein
VIDIVVRESAKADVLALCLGPDGPLLDGVPDVTLPEAVRTAVAIFVAEAGPAGPPGEVRDIPLLPAQRPRLLAGGDRIRAARRYARRRRRAGSQRTVPKAHRGGARAPG